MASTLRGVVRGYKERRIRYICFSLRGNGNRKCKEQRKEWKRRWYAGSTDERIEESDSIRRNEKMEGNEVDESGKEFFTRENRTQSDSIGGNYEVEYAL